MNLEIESSRLLAKVIAGDCGVTLKMEESCKVPVTNGKVITMPTLRPEWEPDSMASLHWWAGLIHECYHHKGTNKEDFAVIKEKKINMSSLYGCFLNIVVDHNIELKEYGKLSGADGWLDSFYNTSYLKIRDKFSSYPEDTKKACALKAVVAFDHTVRSLWSGISNLHLEGEFSSSETKEMYDTLIEHALEMYSQPRDGGLPNIQVTNKLFLLLNLEEEMKSEEEEESTEGESGEGESSKSGDEGDSSESGDGEGEGDTDSEAGVDDLIEKFYDDSGRQKDDHRSEGGTPVKLVYDWDKNDCSGYQMVEAIEYPPKHFSSSMGNYGVDRVLSDLTFTLSDKVKNILKVLSQVKWSGGYKRGKLHRKAIAKVTTGSDVIFRQKEQKVVLDTAVTVLLDSSGSMSSRRKYLHGMLACCMLNDAMNKVGIPIEILGFTQPFEGVTKNHHLVHSTFSKRDSARDLVESMDGVDLANNDDGAAILWAHSRLLRHKAKRKILIVLSDGSPSCAQAGSKAFTKKVVQEIESKSPVEIYGIGILDNNVTHIYKDHAVINSPEQLERALLDVVKSKIIN